jgi:hypothetical protein
MSEFLVWFAGDEEQGYASDTDDASNQFGQPERVQAAGEGAAIWAFNRQVEGTLADSERYFVQRVTQRTTYVADVTLTFAGLPIIQYSCSSL